LQSRADFEEKTADGPEKRQATERADFPGLLKEFSNITGSGHGKQANKSLYFVESPD
jgi:hypothetical protein